MLRCNVCDEPICEERIKSFLSLSGKLPDTCKTHGTTDKPFGLMAYGHKTAGEAVILSNPTAEQKRQMTRAFRRAR